MEKFDDRSEGNLLTLHPEAARQARVFLGAAKRLMAVHGICVRIISGTRSYQEQDALYAQGRKGVPGRRVTNARGGQSNHNFGIAWDIGLFEGPRYLAESARYKELGALGRSLDLEWGGDWKSIKDEPHFQVRPDWARGMTERDMLAALRIRVASGKGIF